MLPDGRSWQEANVTDVNVLVCGDRSIPGYADNVRRYCGLTWSGGSAETWAFRYYEGVATCSGDAIEPSDVLACTALHPGLLHSDLAFFAERADALEAWLTTLPGDVDLADADDSTVAHVASLPDLTDEVGLSLLSKVAHRKRPRLVPLFDRAISDWYRPVTGIRGVAGWGKLVGALQQDLDEGNNRQVLADLHFELAGELETTLPSALRLADIAIWMSSVRS
jgi:hypothetical protein